MPGRPSSFRKTRSDAGGGERQAPQAVVPSLSQHAGPLSGGFARTPLRAAVSENARLCVARGRSGLAPCR